jgi:phosphatidylinositol glycan class N
MIGGGLMFAVGVLYLVFENAILDDAKSARDELPSRSIKELSRIIMGAQVGLSSIWSVPRC